MANGGNTPGAPGMVEQFLGQVGLPMPNQVFQELQRANVNLERMMPDVHRLAGASDAISRLASAMERFNPDDLRKMTQALNEASRTGEQLYRRLWGGSG